MRTSTSMSYYIPDEAADEEAADEETKDKEF